MIHPRFRIYTTLASYWDVTKEILTGKRCKGDDVQKLEEEICQLLDVKHALCMPTARVGIYLSLKSLIKPGQEVILSPYTIVDVVNMVICAGGKPVFADLEPGTGNIAASEVKKLIGPNTGAVMVTHLHGLACEVEEIKSICDQVNVPLLEDAAQAFSTKVGQSSAGTIGKVGIFSFGMYKIVNSFYGGMIVTDSEDLYQEVKKIRDALPHMSFGTYLHKFLFGAATDLATSKVFFPSFTYWVFRHGYLKGIKKINEMVTVDAHPERRDTLSDFYRCKLTPMQARLIRKQLSTVEQNNRKRIDTALQYHEGLKDIPELTLPPMKSDGSHIYTYYAIQCPDRHALMRHAFLEKTDFVLSHYHNTASLDIFKEFHRELPIASETAAGLLYLPTYPSYPEENIKRNIEIIRSFYSTQRQQRAA